ncbi:hypothetical protein RND81_12G047200 [Saponaria officinalis]|uniref:Uncharacterized protein n=1 Tax=Saponaria officinalis TaxID=3572 RepID=A0AAW1H6Q9_SAPOF
MMVGRNPAALILGETLVGLTDRQISATHEYRGCPRMLQIWLMERLHVLAPVPFGISFVPGGVTSRSRSWEGASGRRADYFVSFVRERPIRWVVPWWGITFMTASTLYGTTRGYMICSLEMGIRLHPRRLLRQFGREQKIPPYDTEVVEPVLLTNGMIEDWSRRWADRTSWTVRSTPESTRVTDA